jgi:hypothetical protein
MKTLLIINDAPCEPSVPLNARRLALAMSA